MVVSKGTAIKRKGSNVGDNTSSVTIHNAEENFSSTPPREYPESGSMGPLGISRDTWARVLMWFLPIVFASGALYVSVKNTDMQVEQNATSLQTLNSQSASTKNSQEIIRMKVDSLVNAQKEIKANMAGMDNKLDALSNDLSAIKGKLGVR